jgi:hypothetical protein
MAAKVVAQGFGMHIGRLVRYFDLKNRALTQSRKLGDAIAAQESSLVSATGLIYTLSIRKQELSGPQASGRPWDHSVAAKFKPGARRQVPMQTHLLKLIAGTLAISAGLWAADPLVGTWKLNLAKSKYGTRPAPKSNTVEWTESGGTFHYSAKGVGADGQPTLVEIPAFKFDGKESKITGTPLADTVAFTRTDPNTYSAVTKKAGKVVGNSKSVLAKDGKSITTVWNGADPEGKPQTWTTVIEKQ